jgi:phosphonate transport system substrate-binding protein
MIRKNHRFAPFLIFFALLLLNSPAAALAAGGRGFTLGVMPAAPPVVAHTVWSPFVEHLSRETGVAFRLKVYEKMSEFERDLISPDAPDFIFASPLQTVVGHQKQGFIPLVRSASPVWVELVVKSDSPIRSINDLDQHKIAFVGSKSL